MATPTSLPATFVAGNVLTAAQMNDLRGAFRVLQVVSTTKTDTWTASVAAGATSDVTGLSVTITPSSTSSQILIFTHISGHLLQTGVISATQLPFKIVRGSTDIAIGDTASNRARLTGIVGGRGEGANSVGTGGMNFVDSPNTTSATTYKVTAINAAGGNATCTLYVNRSATDTDANYVGRAVSTITAMEISA